MKTKNVFCSNCQAVTAHGASLSPIGEIVFTCDCGRFVKFAGDLSKKEIEALLVKHEEVNKGQISVEAVEKKLNELLDSEEEEVKE